jgi:hypothetical protein
MAVSILYSKALPVARFETFPGWADAVRPVAGAKPEVLYLHDDLTVTAGIERAESVVFDVLSDEWRRFCRERLEWPSAPASDIAGEG